MLPVELLLYIFKFVVDTEMPKTRSLGWIQTVTHICQLWRDAALANATLWARICTDIGPKWTEEMLRRSSSTLLDIYSGASDQTADRLLSRHLQLPDTMCKVRSLHFLVSCNVVQDIRVPAPSLCRLTMWTSRHHTPDQIVTLPPDLFAFCAPKLQSATLMGCRIPWESPIFNNSLKSLAFGPGYIRGQAADVLPTSSQLYGLLRRTPLLETFLGLAWLPPVTSSSHLSTAVDNPVRLMRLQKIGLAGFIADCLHFLRCISFPTSATVSLTCVRSFNNILSLHDVIPFLVDRFTHSDYAKAPIQKLVITYLPNQKEATISLFVSLPISRRSSSKLHQAFLLKFFFAKTSQLLDFLKTLCQALPLHHVKDLHIDLSGCESPAPDDSFWIDSFYAIQNVCRLEISGSSTLPALLMSSRIHNSIDITHALESGQSVPRPEGQLKNSTPLPSIHIFPALQSLIFARVELPDVWDEDVFLQFCRRLLSIAQLRRTCGIPLREVKVVFHDPKGSLPDGYIESKAFGVVKTQLSWLVSKVRFYRTKT